MRTIGNAVPSARKVEAIASGALSTGDTVAVNSDGTVSLVSETSATQGVGSAVAFSGQNNWLASTYDANSQKVILAYKDDDSSNGGVAVVGTVSGTSISFGTEVLFEAGYTEYISCTYDENAQKVVIVYRDNGNSFYGKAIVGTVSGTSISFGSPVTFNAATTLYTSCAYDPISQNIVIAYRDDGNGGDGTAIVGTVSGTSISFGSEVVFETGRTNYTSTVYDANAQKIVIAYQDDSDADKGKARVATVSGTSISFGSIAEFNNGITQYISASYDANSQKVVISYSNGANSYYGTSIVGTVSGTSISFGSAVVFESSASRYMSSVYDETAQKVLVSYCSDTTALYPRAIVGTVSETSISFGTSVTLDTVYSFTISAVYSSASKNIVISYVDDPNNIGEAVVFQNAYTSTNLTATNYIGIADSDAADTGKAVVNTRGAVDDNQTGLTAGQAYYVQTDGTLSTTAGDPSVFAGTAVSATKLIVKG